MDFSQIAILFSVAALFGIFAKLLNQPLFVGYLFAGIILSAFGLISDVKFLQEFSQIGVALLLFLMGLEMNLKDINEAGKPAVFTAITQIIFTFIFGYLLSLSLFIPSSPAVYIGLALTFSSTIIAVRLMSDKKDLNSLYGRITVAILLIQDLVAVLILMFLSGLSGEIVDNNYLITFAKGGLIIFIIFILSRKVLPFFFYKFISGSSELLFIISIAWALGISALLSNLVGFNLETGGFVAGLALSSLPENLQIASRTKPLRDFFLTIFFLILGTNIVVNSKFWSLIPLGILLSIFCIVLHVGVVMFFMGRFGYKSRTSFLVGITGAQVSEFALKISSIGLLFGHLNNYYFTLISLVGVITMAVSTYLINSADKLYAMMHVYIKIFEKKLTKEHAFLPQKEYANHIVLIGCDRAGTIISKYLLNKKIPFVVIDFNPKVFRELTALNIPIVFGDANDIEVLEKAKIANARLVISTISNLSDNTMFLEMLKHLRVKPETIFTSTSKSDGIKLYEKGAGYVIVPEMVAGDYIKNLINTFGLKANKISDAGQKHFKRLIFI